MLQDEAANDVMKRIKRMIVGDKISIYDEKTHEGLLRRIMIRTSSLDGLQQVVFVLSDKPSNKFLNFAEKLKGIASVKPMLYVGASEEDGYRSFGHLTEVDDGRSFVNQLKSLDFLFGKLVEISPLKITEQAGESATFNRLLFTLWARELLNLTPGFEPLSREQVRAFFNLIREKDKNPPYRLTGYHDVFVRDFAENIPEVEPETMVYLQEALSLIWHEFVDEFEMVDIRDMNEKLF